MVDDRTGPEPELRSLRPDEWDSAYGNLLRAFGGLPEADEERQLWRSITEFGRFLAAWDGDRCVASGGAFSFRLTVPGGASVPTAGVTMVSVAATHRRRGLLTAMMRRQLDDIRSWGEPLAVLTASEPRSTAGSATERPPSSWTRRSTPSAPV